ncbi:MAG TPA: hypothetical protein VK503_06985 [Candidatus Bathyarchaeia archaeon]|nr:hypothetical protein [Candidatus Bathyarchaeia archaeon]
MRVATMVAVWVYILLATILEVVAYYVIPLSSWALHDSVISIIALSSATAVVIFYMELIYRPRWEALFISTTLFFVLDLLLIWTASLVH